VNIRLPPLNSLRAFEASARHLSFSKAAQELHVTPAAISHQIKMLEDHLGTPLFKRLNRSLVLTDAGQACLPGIRDGFETLRGAVREIGALGRQSVISVSVAPSFASKWLLPRLERFRAAHPDLDIRITASMHLVDFAREDIDLAVRYGSGNYPNLTVEKFMTERVFPVCSRKLLEGPEGLTNPARLKFHTLLHDDSPDDDDTCPDWRMWLKAAGIGDVDPTRGPRFNQSSLVLEAAVLGAGVALAKETLAQGDLEARRLIRPFDLSVPVDFAYYLVCPPERATLPKVRLFIDWLKQEAAAPRAATRPVRKAAS
jgi:LysR family transcriptional regulator, glycine cleavage system transcriptional activator